MQLRHFVIHTDTSTTLVHKWVGLHLNHQTMHNASLKSDLITRPDTWAPYSWIPGSWKVSKFNFACELWHICARSSHNSEIYNIVSCAVSITVCNTHETLTTASDTFANLTSYSCIVQYSTVQSPLLQCCKGMHTVCALCNKLQTLAFLKSESRLHKGSRDNNFWRPSCATLICMGFWGHSGDGAGASGGASEVKVLRLSRSWWWAPKEGRAGSPGRQGLEQWWYLYNILYSV